MVEISEFDIEDQSRIRAFVLNIQNNEFNLDFNENEQPDLIDTATFYKNGCFWTAKIESEIVGTIGIQQLDNENSVLRKMFVKKEFRGREYKIAHLLFDKLLEFAKKTHIQTIWLDTPSVATASHKFYERNGFIQTDKLNLPINYIFPDKNSKIYKLEITN
jgi:N-acetylglutamate synthase-like GNAT family acetyltransferase